MKFVPINKYLLVEPVEDPAEEEAPTVLLPEDVKIQTSPYSVVKLLRCNKDAKLKTDSLLVVSTHMIEEVTFNGETYYLLLENHVMGYLFP
tara:strand:- start:133 stop:405 length:273 start_codon:yes stop_codon:yes gene_type:complete